MNLTRHKQVRMPPFRNRKKAVKSFRKPRSKLGVPGYTRTGGFYGRFNTVAGRKLKELKFFDTTVNFNFDQTSEVVNTGQLVLIPQGVTESTRIGRKCVIKNIHIQGSLYMAPDNVGDNGDICCCWLVLDKQCNGAAAANNDVFTSTDARYAMINLANSERFVILRKWKWDMNIQTTGGTSLSTGLTRWVDEYLKCNIPLEFSSTTGAITELKSNNIFLIGAGITTDDKIAFNGKCRVRFDDS